MSSRTGTWKAAAAIAGMALLVGLGLMAPARAQVVAGYAAQFDMIGLIQSATINTPGDPLSGGVLTINNIPIVVPRNSIVQMPAATLSWGQVFMLAPASVGGGAAATQTGMAIADCLPPVGSSAIGCLPGTYEAHVQGNIVNGVYIAGLVFLSQQALNTSQGYIQAIDYANGAMLVGMPGTASTTWVQINDPAIASIGTGRFSKGQSPDVRFSVDQDNPTVRSTTGYPMCIPRAATGDALCPEPNRPKLASGGYAYTFTMNPPGTGSVDRDPMQQVPFEVGDYVTYQGNLQNASAGPFGVPFVAAHTVIANVGVYTYPGTNPAYIAIDALLQGTGGLSNPNFPQEVTSRVRVEGFSTDPTRPVDIVALDRDCNGTYVERDAAWWALGWSVDPGPPTGAKKGRFRFLPAGGAFLPPAALVRVRLSGYNGYFPWPNAPTSATAANGLVWGQYFAPEFDFIFGENLGIGDPILASNFGDFTWLVNGIGPWYDPVTNTSPMTGQLSPWPDVTAPTPTCTPGAPRTTLTAQFTATPNPATVGSPITLDASLAAASGAVTFQWNPQIQCGNAACSFGTYIPSSGLLKFSLTVKDANGNSASYNLSVNVSPASKADTVTITSVVYRTNKARLDVNATSSIVQTSPSTCTVTNVQPGCMLATLDLINPATGKPYAALMTNLGAGNYTISFTGVAAPTLVTVTSGNGGSASSGITSFR